MLEIVLTASNYKKQRAEMYNIACAGIIAGNMREVCLYKFRDLLKEDFLFSL